MPYISDDDRIPYHSGLSKICQQLKTQGEEDLGGHLNYCITYILNDLFSCKKRYVRINTLRGAVESALTEFSRRKVAPYEDEKIKENGDV